MKNTKTQKTNAVEQAVKLILLSIGKILGLIIFLITLPVATINRALYRGMIEYELAKAKERADFRKNAKELRKKGVKATSGVKLNYEI